MAFDFAFALEILPLLLRGAVITVIATFGGFAGALLGGLVLFFLYRAPLRGLRWAAHAYVYLIRNTPLLVQLYFIFYVLPSAGITIGALSCGLLGLSLHYSAFMAEVYRAGYEAVPKGQGEAADALGLHAVQKWRFIFLPQIVRPILPVLGNYLIGMFKETPILATITVIELFGAAQDVAGKTYRYNEPYTLVALIFLAISIPCSMAMSRLEASIRIKR